MFKVIAFGGLVGASGETFHKGFRRMPRTEVIEHEVTTEEMRQSAPASLDWTTRGATTPVKNQGHCGSCWAYSTTEGIESGLFMNTGKLYQLSEQQVISCDTGDDGCNGGDIPSGAKYVMHTGGIELQSTYPDTSAKSGKTGTCKFKRDKIVAKVDHYKFAIPECVSGECKDQKETDIKAQLAKHGPLSICVNAATWSSYSGGVVQHGCSGAAHDLDHCVQLVGYDTTASVPYWKVRNSWGPGWGEKGHIRLAMGSNVCGVADEVVIIRASLKSVANASVIV